jgi:hypothetical protein
MQRQLHMPSCPEPCPLLTCPCTEEDERHSLTLPRNSSPLALTGLLFCASIPNSAVLQAFSYRVLPRISLNGIGGCFNRPTFFSRPSRSYIGRKRHTTVPASSPSGSCTSAERHSHPRSPAKVLACLLSPGSRMNGPCVRDSGRRSAVRSRSGWAYRRSIAVCVRDRGRRTLRAGGRHTYTGWVALLMLDEPCG